MVCYVDRLQGDGYQRGEQLWVHAVASLLGGPEALIGLGSVGRDWLR